ncbi:MAG: DNA primase [Planctomycetota bacterium]|jgi:DNA primase
MQGRFDQAIINQVQQANDIVEVVGEHLNLVKKGREMVGLCPFHEDHRPSLYVNDAKQIFKCFACSAGGSVFTFVQMRENLTFPQAIERLAERAGIRLPVERQTSRVENRETVDPNRLAKANAWAAEYFQKNLNDKQKGKQTRDYIAERQITSESAKKWQLGLAVSQDDLVKTAKAQKASTDLLIKAGLVTGQNHDKFVNRLMFPITEITGRVIGFGGRTLDGADAKYINSPTTVLFDKSNSLYGLQQARRQIVACGVAVVVEGYTDCIMAHQFGCCNVVATLGTSFTDGHGRILRRYAKKAVLIFDSDTAGIEAANRALEVCLSQHIDIKLASVPEGNDPCDFLLTAGKESFERLVDEAVDVFKFKWNRLIESFSGDDTLVDNKAAIEEFLNTIAVSLRAGSLSAIDRGLIVNRLSKIIGLGSKEINAELGKRLARTQRSASYNVQNQKVVSADLGRGLSATAQREILEVLLNEPKLFKTVKKRITAENFDVPILRQAAVILFESLRADAKASLAEILAETESAEISSIIVELAQTGEEKGNFESRLTGAVDAMQRVRQQRKSGEIKTIEEQRQFLKGVCENTVKQNPHNMGMT